MSLLSKQMAFSAMVVQLISKAIEMGYGVTLGDAYRDPRLHGKVGLKAGYGHPSSCHKVRLAIDLNLFKDGDLITSTEGHRPLGEWWESIGGVWGGRFKDGNHYSVSYNGMK